MAMAYLYIHHDVAHDATWSMTAAKIETIAIFDDFTSRLVWTTMISSFKSQKYCDNMGWVGDGDGCSVFPPLFTLRLVPVP